MGKEDIERLSLFYRPFLSGHTEDRLVVCVPAVTYQSRAFILGGRNGKKRRLRSGSRLYLLPPPCLVGRLPSRETNENQFRPL